MDNLDKMLEDNRVTDPEETREGAFGLDRSDARGFERAREHILSRGKEMAEANAALDEVMADWEKTGRRYEEVCTKIDAYVGKCRELAKGINEQPAESDAVADAEEDGNETSAEHLALAEQYDDMLYKLRLLKAKLEEKSHLYPKLIEQTQKTVAEAMVELNGGIPEKN